MEPHLLDWANLLLRWLHVVVAIAWIGSSFYFVFLDNNLLPPTAPDLQQKGVSGAMWAVHGGGFYNPQKYMVAPQGGLIDSKLHWFYWESYSTWLSGAALFSVLYLWNASVFLVDANVFAWTSAVDAGGTAVLFLAVFWFVYDAICRLFGFRRHGELIVSGLLLVVVAFACWLANALFAGRAAFLIVGAMLATAMSANVFFWIIPGQRTVVKASTSGEPFDAHALAIHGKRGKQRSVHNTYFTLPVLFAMLSNHYGFLCNHPQRWLILLGMMLAGALIRQFFVQRHSWHHGRARNPWPFAAVGVALLLAMMVWLKPKPPEALPAGAAAMAPAAGAVVIDPQAQGWALMQPLTQTHCLSCHNAAVNFKNVRLDSPQRVQAHAQQIYQQVVSSKLMPLGNPTGMSEAERALVAQWFQAGAKVD